MLHASMSRLFDQPVVARVDANEFIARADPRYHRRGDTIAAPATVLEQAAILPLAVAALPLSKPGSEVKLLI